MIHQVAIGSTKMVFPTKSARVNDSPVRALVKGTFIHSGSVFWLDCCVSAGVFWAGDVQATSKRNNKKIRVFDFNISSKFTVYLCVGF